MKTGRPRLYTDVQRIQRKMMHNIDNRCLNPRTNKFRYYGGRGIKNKLTLSEIELLWSRDNADNLKQPSIDRIDPDQDYSVENCRIIEMQLNRTGRRKKPLVLKPRTVKICKRCGQEFFLEGHWVYCENCRYETKSCTWCAAPITRSRSGRCFTNKHWFCGGRREWAQWCAKNFGFGSGYSRPA